MSVFETETETKATNPKASAAIRTSWENPSVREKRKRRVRVEVGGQEYSSCRKAFLALGIPAKGSDAVRAKLKQKGDTAEVEGHQFKAIS
ncbi:MAG: hypothetical protein EBV86_01275 [Marivivens sp.]|nr:hypothetical protein [Marivivens sp.]NBT49967.1 hypothetical protein [Marivivens sp.]NCW67187.1 hypothetical protein [Marivivens sp.]